MARRGRSLRSNRSVEKPKNRGPRQVRGKRNFSHIFPSLFYFCVFGVVCGLTFFPRLK